MMEAGEIHSDSYFVYLHVYHFNFLDGGQAFQKFIEISPSKICPKIHYRTEKNKYPI